MVLVEATISCGYQIGLRDTTLTLLRAGVDAVRSFATGCFKAHRTHDLRGLDASEMQSIHKWKKFFKDSDKYSYVGKVIHPPIDPKSPIPEHCEEAKRTPKAATATAATTKTEL